MKKLLLIVISILLVNLVFASSYPDEVKNYPQLEKIIKDRFVDHDAKIVDLEFYRNISYQKNLTILELNIIYNGTENMGLIVYDMLPKELIDNADNFIVNINTDYLVVQNDPIISHYFNAFDKDIKIQYIINKKILQNNIVSVMPPIFIIAYDKNKELANSFVQYYDYQFVIYALVFIGIIVLIYLVYQISKED